MNSKVFFVLFGATVKPKAEGRSPKRMQPGELGNGPGQW
jgi:hypothetical protein